MTEPRRPILKLKIDRPPPVVDFGPVKKPAPARPPRPEPVAAPPQPAYAWKCRPCGNGFNVPEEAADTDAVRCPSCNARLGLAADFRSDPPNTDKLRARPAKRKAPAA